MRMYCCHIIRPLLVVFLEDVPKLDLKILLLVKRTVVILGLVDSYDVTIESVYRLRHRISEALLYVPPTRLMVSPTCGLGYLPQGQLLSPLSICVFFAVFSFTHCSAITGGKVKR